MTVESLHLDWKSSVLSKPSQTQRHVSAPAERCSFSPCLHSENGSARRPPMPVLPSQSPSRQNEQNHQTLCLHLLSTRSFLPPISKAYLSRSHQSLRNFCLLLTHAPLLTSLPTPLSWTRPTSLPTPLSSTWLWTWTSPEQHLPGENMGGAPRPVA